MITLAGKYCYLRFVDEEIEAEKSQAIGTMLHN